MTINQYCLNVSFHEILSFTATTHVSERLYRLDEINNPDEIVAAFYVDRNHIDGPEIHYITRQARILIINATTKRFITILNARPGQIARYYKACKITTPQFLMRKAFKNAERGINYI